MNYPVFSQLSRELNPLIGVTTGSISQRAGIRGATTDPVCRTGGQCRLATQLFHYMSPHVARRARLLGSSKSSFLQRRLSFTHRADSIAGCFLFPGGSPTLCEIPYIPRSSSREGAS